MCVAAQQASGKRGERQAWVSLGWGKAKRPHEKRGVVAGLREERWRQALSPQPLAVLSGADPP